MKFLNILLLVLVLVLKQDVCAEFLQEVTNDLERASNQLIKCAGIRSLSLTILSIDNKGMQYNTSGFGTYLDGRKIGSGSVFCIGGATQSFTAVLLAKLLKDKKNITWDTPIQEIVGHRIGLPSRYMADNLNLKDIFAMRSGLAGMDIVPLAKPFKKDRLISNLRFAPRVAGFRDRYVYNEVLFSLLDEVFQVLGNDTWQNLIKKHVLEPLSMSQTMFASSQYATSQEWVTGNVASRNQPYSLSDDSYSGLELVDSAADLCTSANDMLRWLSFLLVGHEKIFRKEVLDPMFEPIQPRAQDEDIVIKHPGQPAITYSYTKDANSVGGVTGYYKGRKIISQEGSLPGYQSLTTIIPSLRTAVSISFVGDRDEKRQMAKVLLSAYAIDLVTNNRLSNPDRICDFLTTTTRDTPKPQKENRFRNVQLTTSASRPLEDYAGRFRNFAYGDASVEYNSTQNSLLLKYGLAEYNLANTTQNNTFQLQAKSGPLWYSTNTDFYRDGERRIFAEFSSEAGDPEDRISTVKIFGFDKDDVPEFSKNARYEEYEEDHRCSASNLVWQWTTFLVVAIVYVR